MNALQLVTRLISSETQLPAEKLKKGTLETYEWEQLTSKITALTDAPLIIDDTPALSIFELRAKARRLKQQHNIDLIVIDYLQLMTSGGENKGNREQEVKPPVNQAQRHRRVWIKDVDNGIGKIRCIRRPL